MSFCPKCKAPRADGNECPHCGVIYAKAEAALAIAAAAEKAAEEKANKLAAEQAKAKQMEIAERMKPCATCQEPIAKDAKTCPHCGAKNKKPTARIWIALAFAFIVLMFIGNAEQQEREREAAKKSAEAKQAADKFLKENPDVLHKTAAANLCLKAIKAQLRDPESMKVKEFIGHDYREAYGSIPITILTGYYISAKNGFGGYVTEQYICTTEIANEEAKLVEINRIKH